MPNPDFAGSVPRMRCETCKHWRRWSHPMRVQTIGWCVMSYFPDNGAPPPFQCGFTTDLTVCSSWEKSGDAHKPDEGCGGGYE